MNVYSYNQVIKIHSTLVVIFLIDFPLLSIEFLVSLCRYASIVKNSTLFINETKWNLQQNRRTEFIDAGRGVSFSFTWKSKKA